MKFHFYSKLSLRHQIIIPFISIIIGLLVLGFYGVGYFLSIYLQEKKIESVEGIASLILREFEKEANALQLDARLIADIPQIRQAVTNKNKSKLLKNFLSIKSTLELNFIRIVDKNGEILVDLRDRELVSAQFTNKKVLGQVLSGLYLSSILSAKQRSQSVLVGVAPLKAKEGVIGGIIVGTTISDKLLEQIKKKKDEQLSAFSQGKMIASTSNSAEIKLLQEKVPTAIALPTVIKLDSGKYLVKSVSISGLSGSSLDLVLLESLIPLEKDLQELWIGITIFTFLGALIAILIGSVIAKLITKRVENLTIATKKLAVGDFNIQIDLDGNDEISTLGQAFKFMINQLTQRDHKINFQLEELQDKNEILQETLEKLKEAQKQIIAQEKLASLGSLTAGIAHEINTPIGIGVTAASVLEEKTKSLLQLYESGSMKRSELKKYLDTATQSSQIILANLNRAAKLIQSFKQVAVDQSSEEQRIFEVKEYLDEILLQLQPKLKKTKHQIEICGYDSLTINNYPGAFSQIITNLIMNSLIHAYNESDSGNIIIKYQQENKYFILEYEDDGKGIPSDKLNKIFDPFFTTKRNQGGTGLGLHIVYNIVTQKLFGNINCQSHLGVGTKFIIKIPI